MADIPRSEDLHQRLKAFGWAATSGMDALRIEGVGDRGYQVGRAWSPHGTYESLPAPNSMYILLTVEGAGEVTHDGRVVPYEANQIVFLDGERPSTIELHEPTARYLWRFDASVLGNRHVRERVGELIPVRRSVWSPAAALTNGLITAEPTVGGSIHAGRASEHLLAAIFDNLAPTSTASRSPKGVYRDALLVIEQRKNDPAFTVSALSRELNLHERTVRRAFAMLGTTARWELEKRRVDTLRSLLGSQLQSERSFAHFAEAAGFVSARQARSVLRRSSGMRAAHMREGFAQTDVVGRLQSAG
ncbi:hypothetical protein C5E07_18975 [Pseudoclavibacter sp. RFBJ3]|uniref:hypothetical protein n=1 Tax=unclassified Pseudoclavibacter TaxID=2615177 RepID=UPI000CE733E4|nr:MULTISPECIES: hypothetical protein [unclassified Pseudoclavibacter]PPF79555.1 hypothetical protein C5C12_18945 [Pseudoclavibacter sp. RFBJ5]PPF88517.1 hypothetical protein C5E07_18975 [Pseudoclavibacter sp. RFBJ3]PPF94242.1 hypothetical protein C5C19_18645 [Pseudoclavibacter sp. RFBH5]PPG18233.1 hypothetical protein C5E13_18450 [Pseudoclavibacter sp. RFBI4]